MAYRSPYPDITVPDKNLFDMVLGSAGGRGDAVAMADGITGRRITYRELMDQVRRAAAVNVAATSARIFGLIGSFLRASARARAASVRRRACPR